MPRFFADAALSCGATVALPDNVVRHLHVLRCRAGEKIALFNGNGREYAAVLARLDKRAAVAEILDDRPSENESPLVVTLVQAVSAGERMDFTLQKSVELGVAAVIPVISSRSVARPEGERAQKRVARWQEIVVSACEQSGRCVVPEVRPLLPYAQALAALPDADAKLLMSLNNRQSLRGRLCRRFFRPHPRPPRAAHRNRRPCRPRRHAGFVGRFLNLFTNKHMRPSENAVSAKPKTVSPLAGGLRILPTRYSESQP